MNSYLSLKDFVKKQISGDWGKAEFDNKNNTEVYCIRGADINSVNEGNYGNLPIRYIENKNISKFLSEGNIIIEISGGSPTQSTGRVSYVRGLYTNIICSNFCRAFEIKEDFSSKYFFYLIKNIYNSNVFFNFESKTTGIKNLLLDLAFENIKVPKIDLQTQQKIASVLSALDDKIEVNNKINAELEAMAKTLYDYWFVQFEFPNADGKPYKSSGGKMVYNTNLKREIPEGWEVKELENIEHNIITGKTPSTTVEDNFGGDIPFVTIDDIRKQLYIYNSERTLSKKGADSQITKYLEKGDICVSCIGTVGVIGIVGKTCQTNQQINSISKIKDYNRYFLLNNLKMYFEFNNAAKQGAVLQNMNKGEFSSIPILDASIDIKIEYFKKVKDIYDRIEINLKQNQELAKLRDWLLPMLMNGQVRVSEVGIGDRITEYANSEVSHEKLVAETFGEYLPKKQHNINDINKELAALVYLMNYGLGVNYGNVAVQKAVYNSSVITPNLYSKKHDFINYNFGTFSKGLADDLSHNPYLKTKKINGFEVYEIEPSKKNEILNVLSSAENKDFVSSINKLIDLYRQPFINKETNKMELLNTVLKIYSDLKTTDIEIIYQAMKDWKIKQTGFNTKAEKFSKEDTEQIIELLLRNNILR